MTAQVEAASIAALLVLEHIDSLEVHYLEEDCRAKVPWEQSQVVVGLGRIAGQVALVEGHTC